MIILISGAPASGKSTISSLLSKTCKFIVVPQDAFYTVEFTTKPENNFNFNVEDSSIIDWDGLHNFINSVIKTNKNLIIEGHRIFEDKYLMEIADYIFYLDIDKVKCKSRYLKRYSENYTPKQLQLKDKYFEQHVWPQHIQYEQNFKDFGKVIIKLTSSYDTVDIIRKFIYM